MRIRILQRFLALVCGSYFLSCATAYYPKVDFDAAPIHHPIRLAEPSESEQKQIVFRGHYSKGEEKTLTTDAESFRWGVPGSQAGLEVEAVGATYSVVLGISKAEVGSRRLSQAHIGLGYNLSTDKFGRRVHYTLHITDTYHNGTNYIVSDDWDGTVYTNEFFFGRIRNVNPALTLTINTLSSPLPVNLVSSLTVGNQIFLGGERKRLSRYYCSLSLGAYKELGKWGRLIGGFRRTDFLPKTEENNLAAGNSYDIKELFVQHEIIIPGFPKTQ